MATSIEASVKGLLQAVPAKMAATSESLALMFRIPPLIRESNKEFYEPQMVSIGPYHHGSESTQWMEQHKHRYLRDFLDRHAQIGVEVYIQEMETLEEQARKCYTDDINFNNDAFTQMLLLDGCFILELLFKLDAKESDALCEPASGLTTILSDLLLLENQIPFFILEKLYSTAKGQNNSAILPLVSIDLRSLVRNHLFPNKYLHDATESSRFNRPSERIHHLLHLYHELSKSYREEKTTNYSNTRNDRPLVIPSASQTYMSLLKKISPRDIFDVTFKTNAIRIPELVLDSMRETLLMNLHAFEQHMPKSERRWTGLMVLMSRLVKNEDDFKILKEHDIVQNLLPSEEDAIQFFRQLNRRVAPDFNSHYFADLFEQVHEYRRGNSIGYRLALLWHAYITRPWVILSLYNSVLVLIFTFVQTYYAVYSANHNNGGH